MPLPSSERLLIADFATLWGGAKLPDYRRRGIYRATVA